MVFIVTVLEDIYLRGLDIHTVVSSAIFADEDNIYDFLYVFFCAHKLPSKKGSTLKGSKVFSFRVDPCLKAGNKILLTELLPLKVNQFPLAPSTYWHTPGTYWHCLVNMCLFSNLRVFSRFKYDLQNKFFRNRAVLNWVEREKLYLRTCLPDQPAHLTGRVRLFAVCLRSLVIQRKPSEDSDQIAGCTDLINYRMRRLTWVLKYCSVGRKKKHVK